MLVDVKPSTLGFIDLRQGFPSSPVGEDEVTHFRFAMRVPNRCVGASAGGLRMNPAPRKTKITKVMSTGNH